MKTRKLIVAILAATFLLTGAFSAMAAQQDPQQQGPSRLTATTRDQPTTRCNGGPVKSLRTQVGNSHILLPEGGFRPIQDSDALVWVPRGQTDTLLVTLSTEARLYGAGPSDWGQVQVRDNGAPIEPSNDVAIVGTDAWAGHSLQFCKRVGPGLHRIRAYARPFDAFNNSSLRLNFDDTVLSVQVHN